MKVTDEMIEVALTAYWKNPGHSARMKATLEAVFVMQNNPCNCLCTEKQKEECGFKAADAQDNDGWIEWLGGEQPVAGNIEVEVKANLITVDE